MKKTKKQKKIPIEKIEAMAAKGKDVSKYFSKGKMVSSLGKGSGQRTKKTPDKTHSWRLCPAGEHWVRTHPLTIPPSKNHPAGSVTTRRGHCAHNPSGRDQLYPDEIHEMEDNFPKVKEKPCPLGLGYERGTQYDDLIAGWTQYWNDVLQPETPLDPNTVKALMASESSFNPKKLANRRNQNSARGLLQITNETRKILGDEKGELKDHFITVTREELNNPSNNICAGIRWLFRKCEIASSHWKRTATWDEAIYEFKGARIVTKERAATLMKRFNEKLENLKKCEKS